MRSHYLLVTETLLDALQEVFQTETECCTLRQPHRQTLTYCFREHEEFHFLTDLTVVTLLGLFHQCQILIKHLLLRERNTIDTSQLLAVFLTSPVCTGYCCQLDSLDRCSTEQVRTTAKVGERTLSISSDCTVFQFRNQLTLVSFATVAEHLQSICLRDFLTNECFLLGSQFSHLLFDSSQIAFLDSCFTWIYIIVETAFDSRTDTELDTRIEFLQSFCQQVSTCVPKSMLTFCIIPLIKYNTSIFIDRTRQIHCFTIHATSQHVLCQT